MRTVFLALLLVSSVLPAAAQRDGRYAVTEMNFDLWCQEEAKLPPDRCDKRTAEDEKTFEAYRAKVEAYEIPYLQQKNNEVRMDRDFLRADPAGRRQDPNTSTATTPPR